MGKFFFPFTFLSSSFPSLTRRTKLNSSISRWAPKMYLTTSWPQRNHFLTLTSSFLFPSSFPQFLSPSFPTLFCFLTMMSGLKVVEMPTGCIHSIVSISIVFLERVGENFGNAFGCISPKGKERHEDVSMRNPIDSKGTVIIIESYIPSFFEGLLKILDLFSVRIILPPSILSNPLISKRCLLNIDTLSNPFPHWTHLIEQTWRETFSCPLPLLWNRISLLWNRMGSFTERVVERKSPKEEENLSSFASSSSHSFHYPFFLQSHFRIVSFFLPLKEFLMSGLLCEAMNRATHTDVTIMCYW